MTVRLTKMTYRLDRCSRCLADCAAIDSLEIDPLCTGCKHDLTAREEFSRPMTNLTELATAIAVRDIIELIDGH